MSDLHPRQDFDELPGPEYNVPHRFNKGWGQIGSHSETLYCKVQMFYKCLAFPRAQLGDFGDWERFLRFSGGLRIFSKILLQII